MPAPTRQPQHRLTSIDKITLTAECSRCGSGSAVRIKDGHPRCRTKLREDKAHENRAKKYGVTRSEYEQLRVAQNDRCAICQGLVDLCVDHDHRTKAIRGLLCRNCNLAIAYLADSADRALMAAEYLSA